MESSLLLFSFRFRSVDQKVNCRNKSQLKQVAPPGGADLSFELKNGKPENGGELNLLHLCIPRTIITVEAVDSQGSLR